MQPDPQMVGTTPPVRHKKVDLRIVWYVAQSVLAQRRAAVDHSIWPRVQ